MAVQQAKPATPVPGADKFGRIPGDPNYGGDPTPAAKPATPVSGPSQATQGNTLDPTSYGIQQDNLALQQSQNQQAYGQQSEHENEQLFQLEKSLHEQSFQEQLKSMDLTQRQRAIQLHQAEMDYNTMRARLLQDEPIAMNQLQSSFASKGGAYSGAMSEGTRILKQSYDRQLTDMKKAIERKQQVFGYQSEQNKLQRDLMLLQERGFEAEESIKLKQMKERAAYDYKQLGLQIKGLQLHKQYQQASGLKHLSTSEIIDAYRTGTITSDEMKQYLLSLGYDDASASLITATSIAKGPLKGNASGPGQDFKGAYFLTDPSKKDPNDPFSGRVEVSIARGGKISAGKAADMRSSKAYDSVSNVTFEYMNDVAFSGGKPSFAGLFSYLNTKHVGAGQPMDKVAMMVSLVLYDMSNEGLLTLGPEGPTPSKTQYYPL